MRSWSFLIPPVLLCSCLARPPGVDQDGDGFPIPDDCDDADSSVNPDAIDAWYDGLDSDCDGASDYDQDGDGHDDATYGDGQDCDDTDPGIHPGATEQWYDGVDQDCDGHSDYDKDLDGYDATEFGGDDCDDASPEVNPGAEETWYDGTDQDCAGDDDYDQDGDGYPSDEHHGTDCDDTDPRVNPDADERINDVDDDCDGDTDELPWQGESVQAEDLHRGLHGEPSTFDGLGTSVCATALDAVGTGNLGGGSLAPSELVQDGLPDLLLSAPLNAWFSASSTADAAVYLVPGGPARELEATDVADRTVLRLEPEGTDSYFGASLDWVPSLDGDSIPEIAVGDPLWMDNGTGVGMAYLFSSQDWDWAGTTVTEGGATIRRLGSEMATVTFMGESSGDGLGNLVCLGDFDQAGGGDLALTAPSSGGGGYDSEPGAIAVYSSTTLDVPQPTTLSLSDADLVILGDDDNQHVGAALPVTLQLIGDGYSDLVVSAPLTSDGYGRVALQKGGSFTSASMQIDELDLQLVGASGAWAIGQSLSVGGDLDGDGHNDLGVLAESSGGDPLLLVIGGGQWADEADTTTATTTLLRVEGLSSSSLADPLRFELGGDYNADGFPDLAVGSPTGTASSGDGLVAVFWGRTDLGGTVRVDDAESHIEGPEGSWFGHSLVTSADLNADGYDELLVGAPGFDTATIPGIHRPGALFVLDPLADW